MNNKILFLAERKHSSTLRSIRQDHEGEIDAESILLATSKPFSVTIHSLHNTRLEIGTVLINAPP